MCVQFIIGTFTVRQWKIIYSVQGGLRIMTGVHGNALKYTSKSNFKKSKNFLFRFYGNGL